MCLGGSSAKRQMCFGPVCCTTSAVYWSGAQYYPGCYGFAGYQYYYGCYGFSAYNTPAKSTTYIKYVSLRSIAVKYRFRVWLYFILPIIERWAAT